MAGTPVVQESAEHLSRLIQEFRNTPLEKRLTMLRLLRTDPDIHPSEMADSLGCSGRTIQRWLKTYRQNGIDGLLKSRHTSDEHQLDDNQLDALRRELMTGTMETLDDIRQWLHDELGLTISSRSISGILARIGARHVWMVPPGSESSPIAANASTREKSIDIQERIVGFLQEFPVDAPIGDWCREVRDILQASFSDIDRITISVNTQSDLLHPGEYSPTYAISQNAYPDPAHKGLQMTPHRPEQNDIATHLIEEFKRRGHPVDRYAQPYVVHLAYKEAYLGTIFLWREKTSPEISESTLSVFAQLESFLVFVISDAIMRHHYTAPIERVFYSTLRDVAQRAQLTPQEYRVITFRLLGYMYKEIASELNISQDSVKKTLQHVYRKSDTGSHIEFFAKYFTSGIVPPRQSEEASSGLR